MKDVSPMSVVLTVILKREDEQLNSWAKTFNLQRSTDIKNNKIFRDGIDEKKKRNEPNPESDFSYDVDRISKFYPSYP